MAAMKRKKESNLGKLTDWAIKLGLLALVTPLVIGILFLVQKNLERIHNQSSFKESVVWEKSVDYFLFDEKEPSNGLMLLKKDKRLSIVNQKTGQVIWEYNNKEILDKYPRISFDKGLVTMTSEETNEVVFSKEAKDVEINKGEVTESIVLGKSNKNLEVKRNNRVYQLKQGLVCWFCIDSPADYLIVKEGNKVLWSLEQKYVEDTLFKDGLLYFRSDGILYAVK